MNKTFYTRFHFKILLILWLHSPLFLYAQKSYEEWMEIGKYELSKTFPYPDYRAAEEAFLQALKLNPRSAEAYYRLALTYEKMYCPNFENVEDFRKPHADRILHNLKKFSELSQDSSSLPELTTFFEEFYTRVWGRLALAYANYHKTDSMLWAFRQMGLAHFDEIFSEFTRNLLNETNENAILFVNSEFLYYYLLYNQHIKKHRPDVKVLYVDGMNTVWYDVWLQDVDFPSLHISKDEIENTSEKRIEESELRFSHHQIRSALTFPFPAEKVLNRSDWFFYAILQHNAFQRSVYAVASFQNEITRAMQKHWQVVGLSQKLFFEVPEDLHLELLQNARKWKFDALKSLQGKIPQNLSEKLQFYRFPFIQYAFQNFNQKKENVRTLLKELEQILPESVLPMQKQIKEFFTQIQQLVSQ